MQSSLYLGLEQMEVNSLIGVLNDILSAFRSNEGYATPNRYEVVLSRPAPTNTGTSENQSRGGGLLMQVGRNPICLTSERFKS